MKKKRILIVDCYIDEVRYPINRALKVPQPMAPSYLAGMFSTELCEIKLFSEVSDGPLDDEKIYSFPDMVILTGLNTAFDRMLHLTAYARTKNKNIIVVAGGPAVRTLPQYSKEFFDYCCIGDIEQMEEIIRDAFGDAYISETFLEKGWAVPRYDLTNWMKIVGYLESSRHCYLHCGFCSLTGERAKYQKYEIEYLRKQLETLGKRKDIAFVDNNFASPDRQFYMERIELLKEFRKNGKFSTWSACVSSDFFFNDENLKLAYESGCVALFSGIESFSPKFLKDIGKVQHVNLSSLDIIKNCLSSGILFTYGLVLDIINTSVTDIRKELNSIFDTPEITLPSYLTLPIPMLGTPYFYKLLNDKRLLPNTRFRDMNGRTITVKPTDSMAAVVNFMRETDSFKFYSKKAIKHGKRFFLINKKNLTWKQMGIAFYNMLLLAAPELITSTTDFGHLERKKNRKLDRTYIGSTEPLDYFYKPAFRVDSRFEHYFEPTMLTDHEGNLVESLYPDLLKN